MARLSKASVSKIAIERTLEISNYYNSYSSSWNYNWKRRSGGRNTKSKKLKRLQ